MSKFKSKLDNRYEKDLKRAKDLFQSGKYKKAELLSLKIYKYYKSKGKLSKAYDSLNLYIAIILLLDKISEAEPFIRELLVYSIKNKNKFLESSAKGHLGLVFKERDFDRSRKLFEDALKIDYELNDHLNIIRNLSNIGNIFYMQGSYEKALESFNEAKNLSIKTNQQSEFAPIYASIALIYLKLKDFEKFNENYELALQNLQYNNNPVEIATILNNSIADIGKEKVTEEVFHFLNKILQLCEIYDLKGIKITILSNLAKYFNQKGEFEEGEKFLKEAIELANKYKLSIDKGEILNSMGYLYFQKGDIERAIDSITKSIKIAKKLQHSFLLLDDYILMGELYKIQSNYNESYRNFTQAFQNYHNIVSSISSYELKAKFINYYQELPKIIEELNDIIESEEISPNIAELSKLQKLSNETCKILVKEYADFEFEKCIRQNDRLKDFINKHKSRRLEEDARELFRKKDFFNVIPSSKDWALKSEEIDILFENKCIKDRSSKTIEIDVYGKKEIEGKRVYLLGECKYKNKNIDIRELKCFIIKVNIITQHIIEHFNRKYQKQPLFHLFVISLGNFPEYKIIQALLEKYWSHPKGRIINRRIEIINYNNFINLLKANNISLSYYIQFKEIM